MEKGGLKELKINKEIALKKGGRLEGEEGERELCHVPLFSW